MRGSLLLFFISLGTAKAWSMNVRRHAPEEDHDGSSPTISPMEIPTVIPTSPVFMLLQTTMLPTSPTSPTILPTSPAIVVTNPTMLQIATAEELGRELQSVIPSIVPTVVGLPAPIGSPTITSESSNAWIGAVVGGVVVVGILLVAVVYLRRLPPRDSAPTPGPPSVVDVAAPEAELPEPSVDPVDPVVAPPSVVAALVDTNVRYKDQCRTVVKLQPGEEEDDMGRGVDRRGVHPPAAVAALAPDRRSSDSSSIPLAVAVAVPPSILQQRDP